MGPFMNFGKNT